MVRAGQFRPIPVIDRDVPGGKLKRCPDAGFLSFAPAHPGVTQRSRRHEAVQPTG